MIIVNEKITIIQGEKIDLPLTILQSNGKAFNLTGSTEIKFCIFDSNGDVIEKKLSDTNVVIDDPVAGEITVKLASVDTLLMAAKDNQSFDVEITQPTSLRIAKFSQLMNVEQRICA